MGCVLMLWGKCYRHGIVYRLIAVLIQPYSFESDVCVPAYPDSLKFPFILSASTPYYYLLISLMAV